MNPILLIIDSGVDWYSWGVIVGLALIITGSLIRWAYGNPADNQVSDAALISMPEESARLRRFLAASSKGLGLYALLAMAAGGLMVLAAIAGLFYPGV